MKDNLRSAQPIGKGLALLSRPNDFLYAGSLVAITSQFYRHSWPQTGAAVLIMFSIYTIAVSYNNLQDYEIDKVNARHDNPLVSGMITPQIIKIYMLFLSVITILNLFYVSSIVVTLSVVLYMILLSFYSSKTFNIQARGIWGLILLSVCYGIIPILIGLGGSGVTESVIKALVIQPWLFIPILLAKDYKDLKGDKKFNKKTFLLRHGQRATYYLALVVGLFLLISILFLVVYFNVSKVSILFTIIYLLNVLYIHKNKAKVAPFFKRLSFICMILISSTLLVL